MQYKSEYDVVETKDEFISLLYGNYNINWRTAERRWYDLYKLYPKKIIVYTDKEFIKKVKEIKNTTILFDEVEKEKLQTGEKVVEELYTPPKIEEEVKSEKYPSNEIERPPHTKMMELEDMKKYKHKITRQFLSKYGFNNMEINWLEEKGYLEETK